MTDREEQVIDELNKCETLAERLKLENELDNIRRAREIRQHSYKEAVTSGIDNISDYNYYPNLYDDDFNQKIYNKKEFRDHRMTIRTGDNKSCGFNELIFKRTPSQNFSAHYMSSYTPYNGILLWHGVGIGKTCTALSIAENFKDYTLLHGKKIIILMPSDTLRDTWRNEIFNIDKEINKYKQSMNSNVQCTGDRYKREILFNWDEFNDKKLSSSLRQELYKKARKSVNTVINKYYKLLGYQMLVNDIEKRMKQRNILNGPEYKKIEFIRSEFSNTVIIMDEAHFLRDDTDDDPNKKDSKIATPYIEMIARYAENSKIILSTATPMYNKASEIVWLLNILLMNDKRAPLVEKNIFTSDGAFKDEYAKKALLNGARGYISYVRAENPFDFPIKLEPEGPNVYTPNPEREWYDYKIPITGHKISGDIKFYKSPMAKYQFSVYLTYANKKEKMMSFEIKPKQASNIVFPQFNKDDKVLIGNEGFNKCIQFNKESKKYEYTEEYNNNMKSSFLESNRIGKYSSKFKNILESIKSSVGIVFVYSQYIDVGIKSFSMVLEENGFMRYDSNDKIGHLLNTENTRNSDNNFCAKHLKKKGELSDVDKKTFKQATYIYLDGTTKNITELLRDCNNSTNNYGHNIKVILGSRVTGQGLNFKNVREVHIMDPWFHFNSLQQSIGRAIRRNSHNDLPPEERNATIYIHCATTTEDKDSIFYNRTEIKMETTDEHDYRTAYRKAEYMADVQRLLKENAIDCENNIDGNLYLKKDYENMDRDIIDSKGKKRRIHIYDRDGSLLCDLRKCEMTCRSGINDMRRDTKLDIDTFSVIHQSNKKIIFKELIKQIFINDNNYDENSIINEIMKLSQDMGLIPENISDIDRKLNRDIIFKCLSEMINDKEQVYNYEYRPGIIQVFKGSYVFTPLELANVNKYIPLLNRDFPNMSLIPSSDDIKEVLCAKPEKMDVERVPIIDKLDENKETSIIVSYDDKLNKILMDAINFINKHLFYYEDEEKGDIPTKDDMIKYKFQSLFETEFAFNIDNKYEILENILKKQLNNIKLNKTEEYVLDLYDTPNKTTYIIKDRNNKIIGYKKIKINIIDEKKKKYDINQLIYVRDLHNNFYISTYEDDKKYEWKDIINEVADNEQRYISWLGKKTDNTIAVYVNLLKKIDNVISKKTLLKGALCLSGSINILKNKKDLEQLILDLGGKTRPSNGNKKETITRDYLCYELELLLRHLDNKYGSNRKRYFYRMDEKEYIDVLDEIKKK
jgi:hypothetical protein